MQRIIIIAVGLLLAGTVYAQPDQNKYWVFFDGKSESSEKAGASHFVTSEAAKRRLLRGDISHNYYDQPVSENYIEKLALKGVEPILTSRWLNAVSAYLTREEATDLEAQPYVMKVQPVKRFVRNRNTDVLRVPVKTFSSSVSDSSLDFGPSRTQLEVINAIGPLERGINGKGVRIGFLDTTFGNFSHSVFEHLVDDGRLIGQQNFTEEQSNLHGMQVASVAVGYAEGSLIGPAWGAEVLAGTTEFAPTETNMEEDNLVAGLEWMEAQGADVVNISLGYSTFDAGEDSYTFEDMDGDKAIPSIAADIAARMGVVVVVSAGNEGCSSPEACWYYITSPADADSVLTVGAVNADSTRPLFSSRGPTADGRIKPDVAAQGTDVIVAIGPDSYWIANGTSFSSPLTAGVAAQILQVNADLTPMDVIDILRTTASQADSPNNQLGWGIINAEAAIERASSLASSSINTPTKEYALSEEIEVYPNPSRGIIRLRLQDSFQRSSGWLRVYNVLGQLVHNQRIEPDNPVGTFVTLDTSSFTAGTYFIRYDGDAKLQLGRFTVF